MMPSKAWVRTDPALLRRVLQNYLSNAIRYGRGNDRRPRVLMGCRRIPTGIRIEVLLRDGRRELAEAGADTALVFSSERVSATFTERVRPVLGECTEEAAELLAELPYLQTLDRLTALFKRQVPPVHRNLK